MSYGEWHNVVQTAYFVVLRALFVLVCTQKSATLIGKVTVRGQETTQLT
jgi:hypothetical protein